MKDGFYFVLSMTLLVTHDLFLPLAYYPVECFKRSCLVAQFETTPNSTEIDSFFSVVASFNTSF